MSAKINLFGEVVNASETNAFDCCRTVQWKQCIQTGVTASCCNSGLDCKEHCCR